MTLSITDPASRAAATPPGAPGRPGPPGLPGRLRTTGRRWGVALGLAWQAGRALLIGYVAVQLVAAVPPVVTAWLVKTAVDRLAGDPGSLDPVLLGLGFAGGCLAGAATPPVLRYLEAELERRVGVLTKDLLYTAVGRIELLSTLEDPQFRDRLRLAEQASQNGPAQVVSSVLGAGGAVVTGAGMVGTVAVIAPWLAVLLVASAVPALLAEVALSRRRAGMLWRVSPGERRGLFFTELLTNLSAAKELRLFGSGRLFHRRMLAELAMNNAERRQQDRRELVTQGCLATFSALLAGGALLWVLVAARRGDLSGGDVAAIVAGTGVTLGALSALVQHAAIAHHAGLMLDHYRTVVSGPANVPAPLAPAVGSPVPAVGSPGPVTAFARGIELVDVWFRYAEGQPWVLRGVNLTFSPRRAVALVGENGAGKSTLIKLLCRFYDPTRGVIRWDGVDVRTIPLPALRRRIAAVFQDFMSYDLTAAENIALGDVDGADELDTDPPRLTGAARGAEVLDTVEALPRRWDTMLSRTFVDYENPDEDGVLLSGGQWQRLALARALLRADRDLLILDEPSSGLDPEAEHRIHHRLARRRGGRISVLISHRLNTVRDADEIVVLAGGMIVERGTHARLLAAGGRYARLFELQASGYQAERDDRAVPT